MAQMPGKTVARKRYLHASALSLLDVADASLVREAERLTATHRGVAFNVVRIEPDDRRVALLHYPTFAEEAFPALRESWFVDVSAGRVSYRTYEHSLNPPILHRKELLLPNSDPRCADYAALTNAAELIGLFDDPSRIGFRQQWEQLVRDKGYQIVDHELVPVGNVESFDDESESGRDLAVARHLTALVRYGFSAPIQTLARYGYLDGRYSVFDYGCGRGDDVRGLRENGLQVGGWDPHYAPGNPITAAHIVNLGFVINVIEDFNERVDAVLRAYALAEQLLIVSVMLANQSAIDGQRYNDGVLTKRHTFQKYYTQAELRAFLAEVIEEEPIAVGPGIFYVFRDKDAEQRFLAERFRTRRTVLRQPSRPPIAERTARVRRDRAADKYASYREPLERLWSQWVRLGREPEKAEVDDFLALIQGFGTLNKALRFVASRHETGMLDTARRERTADLEVYFALNQFERRKPYRHLEPGLQRDIKVFFGDYANAQQSARDLLFTIANPEAINTACRQAAEHGLGWLIEGESLQLHVKLVEQLPPLLRVYVGCASVLYGDYRSADLVKIHVRSGKLTLMRFDDFEGMPLPRMVERVKIKLRQQDFDYFAYGDEFEPPYLYHKSQYINEEFPNYPEQIAFDEALAGLSLFDLSGYGPKPAELQRTLDTHRWQIDGFKLIRSRTIPDLDALCGRYLKFRDLIECGETQANTGIPNLPKEPESYNALYELAVNVLDPVIDYFGAIKLTYGFCSNELAKHIKARVSPDLDQHASHERKRNGKYVCDRLGAAVDFLVEDEDMKEVAQWIASNTPFDRLYYYGPNRPIHVSFGDNNSREAYELRLTPNGNRVPARI